jgi:GWxTD domain-containing protein
MIVLVTVTFFINGLPQSQTDQQVSLDTLEKNRMLEETIRMYEAILDDNPFSQRAISELGKIAVYREDWEGVKENYEHLLEIDPYSLEAAYYLGMAYRETGKFKALLLRKWDWDKSEKHYEQVLKSDSSFSDVLYQYAVLKRYREKYDEAIELDHRQIALRPDLVIPQVKIFRFYRYFISHTPLEASVSWLAYRDQPHARFAIAEAWRRKSLLKKADSLYQRILKDPGKMPVQPVLLAMTRIYAARDLPQKVDSCFWTAVNGMKNKIESDLIMEDLKYLLTDQEYKKYQLTTTMEERISFFKQFWTKRNPLPAANLNVRLTEHYKRLNYAEENFEYDGFRTWFSDPDQLGYLEYPVIRELNQEYNDMGLIYIRQGPPDDVARTAGPDIPINESWRYYQNAINPEMIFHFLIGKTGNDWRFAPVITDPAILSDRLNWGNIYHRMLQAGPLEELQYQEEMAAMSRQSVSEGLTTERHSWPEGIEPFNFPISIESFRADSGNTRVDISYEVPPPEKMSQKIKIRRDSGVVVESGLAVFNRQYEFIHKNLVLDTILTEGSPEKIETYTYLLFPDTYYVSVHIDPLAYNVLGGYKFQYGVTDYSGGELQLSDIQLATRIEPGGDSTGIGKNGLFIMHHPSHKFDRKTPVYIYFEVYNLQVNDQKNSQYSLDYNMVLENGKKRGIGNLFGLLGGGKKSSISIRNERQEPGDSSVEYLALDTAQMESGDYKLEITVTDELSGDTVSNEVFLTLE